MDEAAGTKRGRVLKLSVAVLATGIAVALLVRWRLREQTIRKNELAAVISLGQLHLAQETFHLCAHDGDGPAGDHQACQDDGSLHDSGSFLGILPRRPAARSPAGVPRYASAR